MAPRLILDRKTLRLIAIAFLLLTALTIHRLYFAPAPEQMDVLVIDGETMGTTYQIRIAGDGLGDALRQAAEAETERRLDAVDAWMSNWNPESEVSRFNDSDAGEGFPVSAATAEVVAYAIELSKLTGGAFDITVGPLVSLWGFGNEPRIDDPPSQSEIDALLAFTGARVLRVGRGHPERGGFLRKAKPQTRIDLSAIAKGFGVDHVAAGLRAIGRDRFLVEIGGEVVAAGERPGGGPWRVAIEKPDSAGRSIQAIVELQDRAMATSGDYRIFYRDGDRRISHTIDPRTGRPVVDGPASVTVLHRSATIADAWATALMVLGEAGLELAEREEVAALLMRRTEGGDVSIRANALFPRLEEADRSADSRPPPAPRAN